MVLSRDEVVHVARLAHVGLTDEEIVRMARELSSVIDHVSKLRELDTEGVEPTAHNAWGAELMRDDEPSPSWSPEMVLANAPMQSGNLFEVQAILD